MNDPETWYCGWAEIDTDDHGGSVGSFFVGPRPGDDVADAFAFSEQFHNEAPEEVERKFVLMAAAPRLLDVCERANALFGNLMKAVPWGQTFDLDFAALNEVMYLLPRVIASAKPPATDPGA
jgi:hypothetical protein